MVDIATQKRNPITYVLFGVGQWREVLSLLPGTLLAATIMAIAVPLAELAGQTVLRLQGIDPTGKASPISGVLMAIVIGMMVATFVRLPDWFRPGIQFSMTKLLRLGIIFVGIKLSVMDVLKLGAWGIPVVATAIVTGMVFVRWFNNSLRLSDRLGTLLAAGTSICGVTAIVSTAPAIKADEKEVAYAIANVTLFGLLGMFLYPYLAHALLKTSEQVGLFLGTAVHETSQVVGAALTYKEVFNDEVVLKAATVTKLTRNLFLAVVVPFLSFLYLKQVSTNGVKFDVTKLLPAFVLGFIAMAIVRSIGDATLQSGAAFGIWTEPAWESLTKSIGEFWGSRVLLGTAMAAVGLNTHPSVFKGVGAKPFLVGFVGALVVGLVGFGMAATIGQFVKL
ncbi:MAG: YeiH family protein [Armatimonadota bacterium]